METSRQQQKGHFFWRVKEFCKEPYCYVAMACICLLLLILGLSGSIAYHQHNSKNPTTISPKTTTTVSFNTSTISVNTTSSTSNISTTTSTSNISTTTVSTTTNKTVDIMPELAVAKLGDYSVVASEEAGLVTVQMARCENCPNILFNKTQIAEIHKFIMGCDGPAGCPIEQWPYHTGFCIVCNPVVRMRTSKLHLCMDYHRTLSSGFIGNYTLNYDTLQLLGASNIIVNRPTI